jgi:thiamine-phosphate pyrophosphorylase
MDSAALGRALRLYLIADTSLVPDAELVDAVGAAIRGGVSIVQLRAKGRTTREQLDLTRALVAICRPRGIPVIVNDRVDVALAAGADGVHVGHIGMEDLPPDDARRLLGRDAIVGVSVNTGAEAAEAERRGASYVSGGPMYRTSTKPDAGAPLGPALVAELRGATTLPVVAIGGIEAVHVPALLRAGASGVCVAGGILRATDRQVAARAYLAKFDEVVVT